MSTFFETGDCLKLAKPDYKELMDPLRVQLGELQRELKKREIPVLIIFEGLDASGKGAAINEILLALDPRGYKVVNNDFPSNNDGVMFRRYWKNLPGKGEFHIFDRSWYYCAFNSPDFDLTRRCNEVNETEKMLIESGVIIIKIFLHTSRKEQKKRFLETASDPVTAWKVKPEDWKKNRKKNFELILNKWAGIIDQTNNLNSEWNVICSDNLRGARYEVYRTIVESLKIRLENKISEPEDLSLPYKKPFSLSTIDLSESLSVKEYRDYIGKLQKKLYLLQHELYLRKIPLVIAYEGWDAGGKGGNIRRLVEKLDPRSYDVIPIAAPNDYERKKHYLWRFWRYFPRPGHITIFDRTWYGRVLVERVENFANQFEWKRAFKEINDMEKQWVNDGAIVVKFWLHISPEEQLIRFEDRGKNPEKKWKITDEDWRNREKWDLYRVAVEEMISRTSEHYAPWDIVPANNKYYARVFTLQIVVNAIEARLTLLKENEKKNKDKN